MLASDLKIDGTVTAIAAIAINDAKQTLEIGTTGSLTIAAAESIINGTIQLDGGTLIDGAGVTIGSSATLTGTGTAGAITLAGGVIAQSGGALAVASITGSGTVSGAPAVSGAITASGGTLDLTGTPAVGSLAIDIGSASDLKIDGILSAGAFAIDTANQTLEIGNAGSLTIAGDETVANGSILLDGAGSKLSATGLTVGSGTFAETDGAVSVAGQANFAGGTDTISAGTFRAAELDVAGTTLTLTSGTLTTTINDSTSNTIASGGTISLGGGTLDYTNAGGASSGGVTDSGSLFGNGTIDGAITGTGTVEASSGTLTLNAASIGNGMTIDVDAGATLVSAGTGNAGTYFLRGTNTTLSLGGDLATGTVNFGGSAANSQNLDLTSATLSGSVGAVTGFSFGDVIQLTGFAAATHAAVVGSSLVLEDSGNAALYTFTSFSTTDSKAPVAFSNTGGVVTLNLGADGDNNFLYATTGGDSNFSSAYAWSTAGNWDLGQPQTGQNYDLAQHFATGKTTVDDIATLSAASLDPSSGLLIIDAGSTLTVGTGGITAPGTVEILGTLVVNALVQPLFGDTILMRGGTLQGPDGGSIGDNTTSLTGFGFVRGGTISGTGAITASGGTLDISNAIDSGAALAIGSTVASDLLIDGTATSANAIAIGSANQTLEIGTAGSLTITAAENITTGTIKLDGGTLIDSAGVTIGSAATLTGTGTAGDITVSGGTVAQTGGTLTLASITGQGTVSGAPGVSGAITASGGTLDLTGTATFELSGDRRRVRIRPQD